MNRKNKLLKIKKSISKVEYLRLKDALELKSLKNLNSESKSVKFQQFRLLNIEVALTVLYHTGIRVSELSEIQICDIADAIFQNEFFIYQGKSKTTRSVTISKNAVADFRKVFDSHLSEVDRNTYILRRWGNAKRGLAKRYIEKMLNKFIHEVLGERYSTHGFRKGLINDLIYHGHLMTEVQALIGHKHVSTTAIYVNELSEDTKSMLMNSVR